MIRKTIKYSLFLLLLIVVVLLTLPLFIDANRYKPLLIQYAEEATGQSIETGDLSLSFFPWVKLRIEDIRLTDPAAFTDHELLRVEHIDLQLATLPLLSGNVEIYELELEAPELQLVQHLSNRESEPQTPDRNVAASDLPEIKKIALLTTVRAESIRIHQGRLLWVDPLNEKPPVAISDLNLSIDNVQFDAPVHFTLGGLYDGAIFELNGRIGPLQPLLSGKKTIEQIPLQIQIKADHLPLTRVVPQLAAADKDAVKYVAIEGRIEQRPDGLRISDGKIKLLGDRSITMQWHVDMPNKKLLNIRKLALLSDEKALLESHGEVRLSAASPTFELRLESGEIQRADLRTLWPEMDHYYHQIPQSEKPRPLWQKFRVGALISGGVDHIDIKSLQLFLDEERLRLSGLMEWGKKPRLNLRIATEVLHLDPWLPAKPDEEMLSHAESDHLQPLQTEEPALAEERIEQKPPAIEPDLRWLQAWRFNVELQAGKLLMQGLTFSHLKTLLTNKQGRLSLKPLRFDVAEGSFDGTANLNTSRYPTHWRTTATVKGIQLKPLLRALNKPTLIDGELEWKGSWGAKGLLPSSIKSTLAGQGDLLLRNGAVYGFDITSLLQSIGRGTTQTEQKTPFSQLSGSLKGTGGIIHNDDLFLIAPRLRVTGQGQINLPASELDYHLRPRLIAAGGNIQRDIVIPLRLRGDISAPTIGIDLSEEGKKRVNKAVEKAVEGLFKKLGR